MSGQESAAWDNIPSLKLPVDGRSNVKVIKPKETRRHYRSAICELKSTLYGNISSLPIKISTASHGILGGEIQDISASGCKIAISKDLKKGELAKVRFEFDGHIILTKAIVRWVFLKAKGCDAGLEFLYLSNDQKDFLKTICTATKLC